MKPVGYARVSTDKQADFSVSLKAQTATVRAMTVVQSAELVEVIIDAGESLVLNIMKVESQCEREAIGERTRDAMDHKPANGGRVGTDPFGYRLAADALHLEAGAAASHPVPYLEWN